jgi:predicted negative regulator of RcsB-dependent stress response
MRLAERDDRDDREVARRQARASTADREAAASGAVAGNAARSVFSPRATGSGIGARAPEAPAASAPTARAAAGAGPAQKVAKAEESAAEAKKSTSSTEQVERESRKYRAQVLSELRDPGIDGAYAELDRAQSKPELERAQARLRALQSGFGGADAPPNAERIRPDLYCRLAEVALRLGQARAALDWVQRGLDLGGAPSPFVARLYLLQGQARSQLGDRDGAAKSYMKAIEINEQLLDDSLDGRE